MKMISLNKHRELESGRKLKMGKSYPHFQNEGKILLQKKKKENTVDLQLTS